MIENKTEVKPYEVHAMCECGGEFQIPNEGVITVLTSNPPQYPHTCNKCKCTEYFTKIYPYVIYEKSANNPPGNIKEFYNKPVDNDAEVYPLIIPEHELLNEAQCLVREIDRSFCGQLNEYTLNRIQKILFDNKVVRLPLKKEFNFHLTE